MGTSYNLGNINILTIKQGQTLAYLLNIV